VPNPDNINKARWSTSVHEAGHAIVLNHFGIRVRKILVGIDGDDCHGRTCNDPGPDLCLIDELAICVAGVEAQVLLECQQHHGGESNDYRKLEKIFEHFGTAESERDRLCALAENKAREILTSQIGRLKAIARKAAADGVVTFEP